MSAFFTTTSSWLLYVGARLVCEACRTGIRDYMAYKLLNTGNNSSGDSHGIRSLRKARVARMKGALPVRNRLGIFARIVQGFEGDSYSAHVRRIS